MFNDAATSSSRIPKYDGLRMTADEYLALEDDGFRYEVIDGVVVMSPSPTPDHQEVLGEIHRQAANFLQENPIGRLILDVDIRLGEDIVYRPDMIFIRSDRVKRPLKRIEIAPDLVVEVLSPRTEGRDLHTKRKDFETHGVLEYWIIDPRRETLQFLRLSKGKYVEVAHTGTRFVSEAINGFVLDTALVLAAIQRL